MCPGKLGEIIWLNDSHIIGKGLARTCFQHPKDKNICIKVDHFEAREHTDTWREVKYYRRIALLKPRFKYGCIPRYHGIPITNLGKGGMFELIRDETTGEIIWTGARDKGRIISGVVTLTRGGATTDIFYEIAVCINGIPQKDSITALVLPNTTQISTIQTIPITRDLVATDVIKLQLKNTTNTQDPDVFASKISIN